MADETGEAAQRDRSEGTSPTYHVDASTASGVQVGDRNTQVNYFYRAVTWSDRVAAPPLVTVSGEIESPYRGLNSFDERDAAFYFGRDAAVSELVTRMRADKGRRLIVVSGVSGSGKSSLLCAGLVPRLRMPEAASAQERGDGSNTNWRIVYLTPSNAPVDSLAVALGNLGGLDASSVRRALEADPALARLFVQQVSDASSAGVAGGPGRRVLLIVDQFEQIFTLCADEAQRLNFVRALYEASDSQASPSAAVVIIGVRADFEARCADYTELADAVQGRFLLTSMTERQLRTAITEPARVAGSRVEDALVQALLHELQTPQFTEDSRLAGRTAGAGALPLLSHALDQAWRSRVGSDLTLADYERTGGIEAGVAATAQHTYDRLSPRQRDIARDVFLRLVAVQTDGLDVAVRSSRSALVGGLDSSGAQDALTVLESFAAHRLLTLDSDTVEVSHEAVLRAWPLLRDTWLAQTHADRLVRTRLRAAAEEWDRHGRESSYLYQGSMHRAAQEAVQRLRGQSSRPQELEEVETEFLRASSRAQRRKTRVRRATIVAVVALILGLTTSTIWASRATLDAERSSAEARHQRDLAFAKELIARSQTISETDSETARVMSLAAWSLGPSNDAKQALEAAAAGPLFRNVDGHPDAVRAVVAAPTGEVLSAGADGLIHRWDTSLQQPIGLPIRSPQGAFQTLAASPDGKTVAAVYGNGVVGFWHTADGKQSGRLPQPTDSAFQSVAFSPDGRLITLDENLRVSIWASQKPVRPLRSRVMSSQFDTFPIDDRYVAVMLADQRLGVVGSAAAPRIRSDVRQGKCDTILAVSLQASTFVCSTGDGESVWLVDTTRSPVNRTRVPDGTTSAVFSASGRELALMDGAKFSVTIWDVPRGGALTDLAWSGADRSGTLAFTPDGRSLAGGSPLGSLTFWTVRPRARTWSVIGHHVRGYTAAAFLRNGGLVAAGMDGIMEVRKGKATSSITRYRYAAEGSGLDYLSADGQTLVTSSLSGVIALRDSLTGDVKATFQAGSDAFNSALSPDGAVLAVRHGSDIDLFDVVRHRHLATYHRKVSGDTPVSDDAGAPLAFDVHGDLILGTAVGDVVVVLDVLHRPQTHVFRAHDGQVLKLATDPRGRWFASVGDDASIRLWDLQNPTRLGTLLSRDPASTLTLAFSADGQTLAEGLTSGDIRLWDVQSGNGIGIALRSYSDAGVSLLRFSPDGKTLLSADDDGDLRLWDTAYLVDPPRFVCTELNRTFLQTQWHRLAPTAPSLATVCGP